jgi:hypothetical protein
MDEVAAPCALFQQIPAAIVEPRPLPAARCGGLSRFAGSTYRKERASEYLLVHRKTCVAFDYDRTGAGAFGAALAERIVVTMLGQRLPSTLGERNASGKSR